MPYLDQMTERIATRFEFASIIQPIRIRTATILSDTTGGAMTATITSRASVQHLHRPHGAQHGTAPVATASQGRNWAVIGFMVALHALAVVALLPQFWSVAAVATLVVLYWLTACLGVTIGYHRLLSHRAFRVPLWLERFFATCGALSCQHGPIDWVGLHRHHHKFSDTEPDHHNSHRGFWWSHMGWMFNSIPAMGAVPRLSSDLSADPYYRWLNTYFLLLQLPLAGLLFWIGTTTGAGVHAVDVKLLRRQPTLARLFVNRLGQID